MTVPGETEAGSRGKQPCRGIAWWAHRDDEAGARGQDPTPLPKVIGSKDPDALKIPARRAEYSLTENAASPFPAEPAQWDNQLFGPLRRLQQNDEGRDRPPHSETAEQPGCTHSHGKEKMFAHHLEPGSGRFINRLHSIRGVVFRDILPTGACTSLTYDLTWR